MQLETGARSGRVPDSEPDLPIGPDLFQLSLPVLMLGENVWGRRDFAGFEFR